MQAPMQDTKTGSRPGNLRVSRALPLVLVAFLVLPGDSQAYLDAGTGSMIIQVVVAGTAATLVICKTYWSRIKSFWGDKSIEADADNEEHGDN
jgi:hypothetical protein